MHLLKYVKERLIISRQAAGNRCRRLMCWLPPPVPGFTQGSNTNLTQHFIGRRLGALLAVAWIAGAGVVQARSPDWGRTVVLMTLRAGGADLHLDQFKSQIVQRVGEPLDPVKVDQSLKRLYATGRFADLEAQAQPRPGGVELIFIGKAQYFVGLVQVVGNIKPLDRGALVAATQLQAGQPASMRDISDAKKRIKEVLADNGYYRAQIQDRWVRNHRTQEANLVFTVSLGTPAHLSKITFEGKPAYSGALLKKVAGWHVGNHLTSSSIEKGLYKLHNFYLKRGYLQATTLIQKRVFDSKTNTEGLFVESVAGPVIQVEIRGAHVAHSKLKDVLPVYQDGVVDQPALERGAKALVDYFQRKGYFQAAVSIEPVSHPRPGHLLIVYEVRQGDRGVFEGYKFEGNRHFTETDLSSVMTLHGGGFLFGSSPFSNKLLANDIEAIETLYQSRGYLDARITPHLNYFYRDQLHHLFVTLAIQEGPQIEVGKLTLQGVTAEQQKILWPRLANTPGRPYSPQSEQKDRASILQYFANRGYIHVRVDTSASRVPKSEIVNVRYHVELGRQEIIRGIVLLGNRHTRAGIVRRELSFHAGEPADQGSLLESQRRLYELGIFNQVRIVPQNPQTAETQKTILVEMEEARRWSVGYGGGIEVQRLGSNEPQGQLKASPRVSLDVSRLNVGGRNQTLTFQGRLSSLDKGATFSYFIPRFPTRRDISIRINALADSSRNVLTFTAKREEVSLLLEKRWSESTFLSARYSFRNVQALDLSNRISAFEIPLFSRPARIGMFAISYINDHRDDPVNPTRGSYSLADAGVAWSGVGSESDFLRFSAQNSTYYRLGPHLIFARNTRFAVESPYGGLRNVVVTGPNGEPETILTNAIPLPERFFMGGSDSHRGFSINQAGPRDPETGFPIGGNALFLNSLELRMPLANNRLGVVVFHDAGNVYSSIRRMRVLKFSQSSPTDFDYTVNAVGVGLLYKTPVGPLRFDVGYALNPPRFQVAVPGGVEVRQLSHVQYFLSIGQSF